MPYKTILVHVDDSVHARARVSAAARLAHASGACLVGFASTGVDHFSRDAAAFDAASPALAPYLDILRQRARDALAQFVAVANDIGVKDVEPRQTDGAPYPALAAFAPYCDLCVVSHYGAHPRPDGEKWQMAADLAAAGGCPLLLLPERMHPVVPFQRVMLAWNGSAQASRALHGAMPLLQSAAQVTVAILGEAADAGPHAAPPSDIARALSRHGIDARIVQRRASSDPGHTLLELAGEHDAELVVMGCYGHWRVREMLLGGATRSILTSAGIPLLMAA
jgi:nucleotide-binding universal stress UspA family protein